MPFDEGELPGFASRLVEYMTKAVREGKRNSSWLHPNVEHEAAVCAFIVKLLDAGGGGPFLKDFLQFQRKVAFYGMLNSLCRADSILCPDFYQGSEPGTQYGRS